MDAKQRKRVIQLIELISEMNSDEMDKLLQSGKRRARGGKRRKVDEEETKRETSPPLSKAQEDAKKAELIDAYEQKLIEYRKHIRKPLSAKEIQEARQNWEKDSFDDVMRLLPSSIAALDRPLKRDYARMERRNEEIAGMNAEEAQKARLIDKWIEVLENERFRTGSLWTYEKAQQLRKDWQSQPLREVKMAVDEAIEKERAA